MPIDFNVLTKDKKVLTYHIPLNMMRTAKTTDIYELYYRNAFLELDNERL